MTVFQVGDLGEREIIQQAVADKTRLELVGAGTNAISAGLPVMTRFSTPAPCPASSTISPRNWFLTLRAGTPMNIVEDALTDARQMLAFEPPSMTRILGEAKQGVRGTIGGVIAANLSGPRRLTAGAARDFLLGFEAVSGRGELFKSGG